jgi:hypothetical protein
VIIALVIALSNAICPSTVRRLVMPVIVNAVNRKIVSITVRQRPISEGCKVPTPLLTDCNSSPSITGVGSVSSVTTSAFHGLPNFVKPCLPGVSVLRASFNRRNTYLASARFRLSTTQIAPVDQSLCATVAAAREVHLSIADNCLANDSPVTEPITNAMLNMCHMSSKENPVNPGPRWCLDSAGINGITRNGRTILRLTRVTPYARRPVKDSTQLPSDAHKAKTRPVTTLSRPLYYTTLCQGIGG